VSLLKTFYDFICPTSADNNLTLLDLNEKVNLIMSTLADIKAALAVIATNIATETQEVSLAIADLSQQVTELKASLTAGEAIQEADLDSILYSINEIGDGVKAIYNAPVTTVEPTPEVVNVPVVAADEPITVTVEEPAPEVIVAGVETSVETAVDAVTSIEETSEEAVVVEPTPEVAVGPG
jgi:hypothetical protein